ncbi:hypothetical protein FIBSPDRAFT_381518 [Athelia psychrophila]|uniref:Uncharacterized protein n=1 Tax=Athelia psychrophila TaxID=1759441 RepID=A0A167VB84_9AGAM|nr:hypothetical protein FIBSPDRAFT_432788 [Fibularhizoctonia sp. CBS 109695]KZP04825.1 hypothetical protein FIBSPDRAFT_381518 [Fibularhizoctonia sp. CBS 109695]
MRTMPHMPAFCVTWPSLYEIISHMPAAFSLPAPSSVASSVLPFVLIIHVPSAYMPASHPCQPASYTRSILADLFLARPTFALFLVPRRRLLLTIILYASCSLSATAGPKLSC